MVIDSLQIDVNSRAYNYTKDDEWLLEFDPVPNPIYGYGMGLNANFYDLGVMPPYLSYYHIFGINGNSLGWGIEESRVPYNASYSYGWGYEYANGVLADGIDSITINIRVTENTVARSGVTVLIFGSIGVSLSHDYVVTDINGEASISLTVDIEGLLSNGSQPFDLEHDQDSSELISNVLSINGFSLIKAYIDKRPSSSEGNLQISLTSDYLDNTTSFSQIVINTSSDQLTGD